MCKQSAVAAVLDHLHAQPSDAAVFGDAAIDLTMFAACGTSVAMGNAPADVQAAATMVTDDVDEDGGLRDRMCVRMCVGS